MAARRLLIVMLVLLGISSIIAIVVPEPSQRDSDPPETSTTGETGATGNTGATGDTGEDEGAQGAPRVAHETVTLDGKDKREPELVARPGTRMILTVDSKEGEVVEIDGLGLTGYADPHAPAVFDIFLPPEPGRYAVGAPGAEPVATIVTREPPTS